MQTRALGGGTHFVTEVNEKHGLQAAVSSPMWGRPLAAISFLGVKPG